MKNKTTDIYSSIVLENKSILGSTYVRALTFSIKWGI